MAGMSSVHRPAPRFDWFIPIDGDSAHIGTRRAERPPTFEYLRFVVETAEAWDAAGDIISRADEVVKGQRQAVTVQY